MKVIGSTQRYLSKRNLLLGRSAVSAAFSNTSKTEREVSSVYWVILCFFGADISTSKTIVNDQIKAISINPTSKYHFSLVLTGQEK